jgi:hypothetical protein
MTCACGHTHSALVAEVTGGRVRLGIAEVGKPATKPGRIMSDAELRSELVAIADLEWAMALRWASAVVGAARVAAKQAQASDADVDRAVQETLAGRLRS